MERRRYVAIAALAVAIGATACGGGSGGSRPSLSPSRSTTRSPALPAPSATLAPPPASAAATTERPAATASRTGSRPSRTQEPTKHPTSAPAIASEPSSPSQAPAVTPTTTATAASVPVSSSSDETPWGWIIAALVAVAAIVGTFLWLAARRRTQRLVAWQNDTESGLRTALLVSDLLPESGRHISDTAHWQSVRDRVDQAAQALDLAAASAPTPETRGAATDTARALRDLTFALESERLLEDGASPPTSEQLAQADTTTRAGHAELQAALKHLELVVRPTASGAPPAA